MRQDRGYPISLGFPVFENPFHIEFLSQLDIKQYQVQQDYVYIVHGEDGVEVHGEDGEGQVVWGNPSGTITREFLLEEDPFLITQMDVEIYHQEEQTNPEMPELVESNNLDSPPKARKKSRSHGQYEFTWTSFGLMNVAACYNRGS